MNAGGGNSYDDIALPISDVYMEKSWKVSDAGMTAFNGFERPWTGSNGIDRKKSPLSQVLKEFPRQWPDSYEFWFTLRIPRVL